MSRLQRLIRVLACRTGLRTGKTVLTSGNLPLTKTGTFGGFALRDYGVKGASPTASPTPASPVFRKFVGEATFPDGSTGLSLVFTVTDDAGNDESATVSFPGVEPLRAVSGVSDELGFGSGKLTRRVGVCRDPTVYPGVADTHGTRYPFVRLVVGDGTTVGSYPNLLSTHWKEVRGRDITGGTAVGMGVRSGALFASLPRATYRRYVKGCVGSTDEETGETTSALLPSPAAGVYRCDFYDGTSRVFTLPDGIDGVWRQRDVIAVSRSSAILKKVLSRHAFNGTEDFTALPDYYGSGCTLFRLAKAELGGRETDEDDSDEWYSLCSYFAFFEETDPDDMISYCEDSPSYCEDQEYWYFYLPGVSNLTGFCGFLAEKANAGAPVTLVYPVDEPAEITLSSYLAPTETVENVTALDGISDDYAFDRADTLTLVPAMREFFDEEREAGRGIEIYYVLPLTDVTETELPLPPLTAGDGKTVFGVASARQEAHNPTVGWFGALCEQ